MLDAQAAPKAMTKNYGNVSLSKDHSMIETEVVQCAIKYGRWQRYREGSESGVWRCINEGTLSSPDIFDQTLKIYFVREMQELDMVLNIQFYKTSKVKVKDRYVN